MANAKIRPLLSGLIAGGTLLGLAASAQMPMTIPARDPAQTRATPGAGLGSGNSADGAGLDEKNGTELKLGSYIELDENVRNDMYGTIDFPNAEIKDIIKAISKLASKNFILDRKIENRRITIMSPTPVTKQEAYNAFLSALYANDLTVVSIGKFLKIVEAKSALQSNIRVFVGDYAPPSEEIVTVLYPLRYLNAEEIQRFLTDLVPRNGRINAYPNTNTLVMTDTGVNLRRIIAILKSIDIPGHEDQLESLPIRYASAKQIAQLIDEILDAQNGARTGGRPGANRGQPQKTRGGGIITKIVPDDRTNSLVILANGRGVEELKNLVSKLDTSNAAGGGNIHIYYCKNAVAEELATTINSLVSGQSQANNASRFGGSSGSFGGFNPAPPPAPTFNAPSFRRSGGDDLRFEGQVKVTADKPTNSLVVIASGSDFAALRTVLRKLDVPRRQVYVEATIMELKVNDKGSFAIVTNIAAPGAAQAAGFNPSAGVGKGDLISAVTTPAALNGLIGGFAAGKKIDIVNPTTGAKIVTVNTLTGFIKAIVDNNQGQILHQPQILTSDNQEASIKVTNKVPVVTGTTTVNSGTTGATSSVNIGKEDVEIELKITPQVGQDNDLIKLKIDQTVDDFARVQLGGQDTIDRTTRKAATTVVVRDGDTVAVGGLQKSSSSDTRSKFPLLGDLPVLGWLFKGSDSEVTKSNLVLFLKPRVINSYSDLLQITSDKLESRREAGARLYDPKDRFRGEIDEFRAQNKKDQAKEPPKYWGFAPKRVQDGDKEEEDETLPEEEKEAKAEAGVMGETGTPPPLVETPPAGR